MIVARPSNDTEACLVSGKELLPLCLYSLDGELIGQKSPPISGWSYLALEQAADELVRHHVALSGGWEAYLGDKTMDNWIGSSEV